MTHPFRLAASEARLLPDARLAGPMPWVIAIMLFLMTLAAAGGLALTQAARTMGTDLSSRATVQIVEANGNLRERQAAAAITRLRAHPAVARVTRVPDTQMKALLEPWLGSDALGAGLPLPVLIDVDLRAGGNAAMLGRALAAVAPAATVDDHSRALAPLTGLIAMLKWLALALVVLMAGATAAAVVLAARAALNTHRATIDVMHLLGATDVQIARLFQRSIALDAFFGGMTGLAAAAAVIGVLAFRIDALGSELVATLALPWWAWGLLLLLPIAGTLLAMVTARWTVIAALRRIL